MIALAAILLQTTVVHVDAHSPNTMLQQEWQGEWVDRCAAPCNAAVDTRPRFRIGGSGVRSSAAFQLADRPATTIEVRARSQSEFVAGIVLTSVGASVFTACALLGVPAFVTGCDQGNCFRSPLLLELPAAFGVVSLGMAIVGLVLIATNGPSKVKVR